MQHRFFPLTIGGAVTGGKGALVSLLDGHPDIRSIAMWHDSLSALLCLLPENIASAHPEIHKAFHGSVNGAFFLRQLLIKYSDWYNRLESIGHQGYFVFHVSSHELVKIDLPRSFDFYAFDMYVMERVWNMEKLEPIALFRLIYATLLKELGDELTQDFKYAVSMANNDFDEYEKLMSAFHDGKIIYIVRDHADSIAAKLLRAQGLQNSSLLHLIQLEYIHHADINKKAFANVKKMLRLAAEYPDRIFIVDFHDIIENTEETMRGICKWLRLDYLPALEVPSFLGHPMPRNISGKVHDRIEDMLTSNELKALHWYTDYCILDKYKECNTLFFPAYTFVSAGEYRNDDTITYSFSGKNMLLFSGPYLPVPSGTWKVTFAFTVDDFPNIAFQNMRLICRDTEGGVYFDVNCSLTDVLQSPGHSIVLKEEKKLDFCVYAEASKNLGKVEFHGLTLVKDFSDGSSAYSCFQQSFWRQLSHKILNKVYKFLRSKT